jgi:hypothetical protein
VGIELAILAANSRLDTVARLLEIVCREADDIVIAMLSARRE